MEENDSSSVTEGRAAPAPAPAPAKEQKVGEKWE